MTTLIVVKQYMKLFYSKYEVYITPILKFLLAFISLILINANLGYRAGLNKISIVLIAALMCSFMPVNFIVIIAALFVLLHLYAFSLECAVVIGVVFLLMFLLYFRFSPKDTVAVVLTPVCFLLKIPYVIPLSMGLVGTPASAVSVACGVVSYYMIRYVGDNASILIGMAEEEVVARFRIVIDGILNNKAMVVTIVAFSITIILVYFIRRMSIDYAWSIAMVAGALVNIMVILMGDLMFDTNVPLLGAIFGTIVSLILTAVLQFFAFHVDYSRAEKVQFEDDEYYYYVKAVPKVTVARPEKRVKQIARQRRGRSTR